MTSQAVRAFPNKAPATTWNWGAFFLTWIWAIRNRSLDAWTCLLFACCFLPYAGWPSALVLSIYSGMTGNKRAFRNGRWEDYDHFLRVQRKWSKWGATQFGAALVFIALVPLIAEK